MIFRVIRPVRYLIRTVIDERTPRRIAWGIALGMLVGLVPKGNLSAALCAFLLFATRVNVGLGLLTALVVSFISPCLDPLTHGIGLRLLSFRPVQGWIAQVYDLPVFPWLALNNTVVLGSLVLGLALIFPAAHLSQRCVEWTKPRVIAYLRSRRERRGSIDDALTAAQASGKNNSTI